MRNDSTLKFRIPSGVKKDFQKLGGNSELLREWIIKYIDSNKNVGTNPYTLKQLFNLYNMWVQNLKIRKVQVIRKKTNKIVGTFLEDEIPKKYVGANKYIIKESV